MSTTIRPKASKSMREMMLMSEFGIQDDPTLMGYNAKMKAT